MKNRGFLEIFLITLFSTGLLLGVIWMVFSWNWLFYFITIIIISIFVGSNQRKL